jgi:hypothetical protein
MVCSAAVSGCRPAHSQLATPQVTACITTEVAVQSLLRSNPRTGKAVVHHQHLQWHKDTQQRTGTQHRQPAQQQPSSSATTLHCQQHVTWPIHNIPDLAVVPCCLLCSGANCTLPPASPASHEADVNNPEVCGFHCHSSPWIHPDPQHSPPAIRTAVGSCRRGPPQQPNSNGNSSSDNDSAYTAYAGMPSWLGRYLVDMLRPLLQSYGPVLSM